MILEKIASDILDYVVINKIPRKIRGNIAQTIFVEYLLGKRKLYSDKNNGKLIYRGYIDVYYNKEASNEIYIDKKLFLDKLKNEKHFVVDLSLYNLHTKRGKVGLKLQLAHSLVEIRKFLYDSNLLLVLPLDFDISFLGRNEVKKVSREELSEMLDLKNAIVLDPFAEKTLSEDDIRNYKFFLIGGLVDLEVEWVDATKYLYSYLISEGIETRKIVLYNDISGVPDRINSIIKIILEVYYGKKNIEQAILDEMSKRDVYRFITKRFRQIDSNPEILLEIYRKKPKFVKEVLSKYNRFDLIDKLNELSKTK